MKKSSNLNDDFEIGMGLGQKYMLFAFSILLAFSVMLSYLIWVKDTENLTNAKTDQIQALSEVFARDISEAQRLVLEQMKSFTKLPGVTETLDKSTTFGPFYVMRTEELGTEIRFTSQIYAMQTQVRLLENLMQLVSANKLKSTSLYLAPVTHYTKEMKPALLVSTNVQKSLLVRFGKKGEVNNNIQIYQADQDSLQLKNQTFFDMVATNPAAASRAYEENGFQPTNEQIGHLFLADGTYKETEAVHSISNDNGMPMIKIVFPLIVPIFDVKEGKNVEKVVAYLVTEQVIDSSFLEMEKKKLKVDLGIVERDSILVSTIAGVSKLPFLDENIVRIRAEDYIHRESEITLGEVASGLRTVTLVKRADVLEPIYKLVSTILLFSVVGTIIRLAAKYWLTQKIVVVPLFKLLNAVKRILVEGDLGFQIEISSNDEIGALGHAFNKMLRNLKESVDSLKMSQKRLEHVLLCSTELAQTRQKAQAFRIVAKYILEEIALNEMAVLIFSDKNPDLTSMTMVQNGVLIEQEIESKVTGSPLLKTLQGEAFSEKVAFDFEGKIYLRVAENNGEKTMIYADGISWSALDEEDRKLLQTLMTSLSITLMNISLGEKREQEVKLKAEMDAAKMVQTALLPKSLSVPSVAMSAYLEAASQVGGDWYGYHHSKLENRLYLYVGDVTGHGIPSALVTGMVCGAIVGMEKEAEMQARSAEVFHSPEERLLRLARLINSTILDTGARTGHLMTMCFICLDLESGELFHLNAGHTAPLLVESSKSNVRVLSNSGPRLGWTLQPSFKVISSQLNPGDILMIYTDGLTENHGPSFDQVLSVKTLKKLLAEDSNPEVLQQKVLNSARKLWDNVPLGDDVTLLILKWTGRMEVSQDSELLAESA